MSDVSPEPAPEGSVADTVEDVAEAVPAVEADVAKVEADVVPAVEAVAPVLDPVLTSATHAVSLLTRLADGFRNHAVEIEKLIGDVLNGKL